MGLFTPIWMKPDNMGRKHCDRALAVVARMTNPAKLREVALSSIHDEVVLLACKKIDDQKVITDAALRRSREHYQPFHLGLSKDLVSLIKDPDLLKQVAIEGDDYSIGPAAVSLITSQNDLAKVAFQAEYATRIAAIHKLTDQNALANIALTINGASEAISALRTISDEKILAGVLVQMPGSVSLRAARAKADSYMTNSDKHKIYKACEEAVNKIYDPGALLGIYDAWKDIAAGTDHAAIERKQYLEAKGITEKALELTSYQQGVLKFYFDEEDWTKKRSKIQNADQAVLAEIARQEPDYYLRMEAMERITEEEIRKEIQASWCDEWRRGDELRRQQAEADRRNAAARALREERRQKGLCPNCGVRLAMISPSTPVGSILYCSNCKARIGIAARGGGIR